MPEESLKFMDIMGCVTSVILFLLASIIIPFLGPFFSLLTPLPFLYYSSKLGLYEGLKLTAVTLFIVGLLGRLAGFSQIIYFCIEFSLLGYVISEIFRRRLTFGLTVFLGTAVMLLIGTIILFIIGMSRHLGPLELILRYFERNLMDTIKIYENMGLEHEKVVQLEHYTKVLTTKIYPALIIVGTGFVVWVNVVLSRPLFRIGKLAYPDFGPMDRWRTPEPMVWGVIVAGFALFFPVSGIKLLALNSLLVMLVIYVFHGLSIVLFFLNKYKVPFWIRFGVYFLLIFQQIFLVALALAGLFDQWIDLRRIHKKEAN